MNRSRRDILRTAGAGLAVAALNATGFLHAQQTAEANSPSVTLVRKGINKEIKVINIDLLEAQAKTVLPEASYVFISNGNGEQWTLRENRRAFGDFVFIPHRMTAMEKNQ